MQRFEYFDDDVDNANAEDLDPYEVELYVELISFNDDNANSDEVESW